MPSARLTFRPPGCPTKTGNVAVTGCKKGGPISIDPPETGNRCPAGTQDTFL